MLEAAKREHDEQRAASDSSLSSRIWRPTSQHGSCTTGRYLLHVNKIRVHIMPLQLILLFIVSSSTKIVTSLSTTILGDRGVVQHTESLTPLGIISIVAGGQSFSSGLKTYGIPATAAKLYSPWSVALDAAGNFFISTIDDIILKVTASTGIITLVAGTGDSGFSGDGAAATAATFSYPSGIALDKFGDIYVADQFNNRIRKITVSSGIITTVAGNSAKYGDVVDNIAATSSRLSYPKDVAVDANGNIYITDSGNYRIRKVTSSTGIITTIAGKGDRSFSRGIIYQTPNYPALGEVATRSSFGTLNGITLDSSGNVFFTDRDINSIYKIIASTGLLTLVAGANNDNYGYNGDDILAVEACISSPNSVTLDAQGNIFFSDGLNYRIRKITASTGIITTVAGNGIIDLRNYFYYCNGIDATLASLSYTQGVAVDTAGSIYFCEKDAVRKVTYSASSPSSVVTQAPSVTPVSSIPMLTPTRRSTSGPTGITSTVAGSESYSSDYPAYGIAATNAKLFNTSGVAVDAAGNFVVTTGSHMVMMVTASTGILTVVAGTGKIGFRGDGAAATAAELNSPLGIALDKFGDIYVADHSNNRIRKITVSSGIITTVAGASVFVGAAVDNIAATSARLIAPMDVAVDADGNIYITDTGYYCVRKVTASTGIITTIAGNGKAYQASVYPTLGEAATLSAFGWLKGITVDTSGNVFFTDRYYNGIYKITAGTGLLTLVAGMNNNYVGYNGDDILATTALINNPSSISLDAQGNVYFSDTSSRRIRKVTASTGIIITVAGNSESQCYEKTVNGLGATVVPLCTTHGVDVDTAGSIYFCEKNAVRKVTYSASSPSSVVTQAPSVTPVSSTPAASQPVSASAPVPVPTVGLTPYAALLPSAPRSMPVPSMTVSPTPAAPQPVSPPAPTVGPTLDASKSSAPLTGSPTGPQSSSTTRITGGSHLTIILLIPAMILFLL